MSTRNQTKIKTVLILAAVTLAVVAGPALAAVPVPTGTNPATGNPWANGDMYRLAFITSSNPNGAQNPNIAYYNALVQGLADDAGLGDAAWYCIGSTGPGDAAGGIDARDNTSTNPTDPTDPDCPILLVDGITLVAVGNADLWDGEIAHTIDQTETGGTPVPHNWAFTGTYLDGTISSDHGASGAGLGGPGEVGQGNGLSTTEWIWRQWTMDPPATPNPLYAMSEALVIGGGGPTYISPEDGSTVNVGDVDLLWENMDPNKHGDPVYVDVWFGTEPNELDPGYDMTKVVTAEPNVTSVTVSAPTEGAYYWKVGNYIYGSTTGDPCEGGVWSFYALEDFPPSSVDAGDDMITWSGEPVPLDATVVDDDASPLTYLWTVDPVEGVVVAFSDPSIEAPTVTITKVPFLVPFVDNPSFEDPVLADGLDSWSLDNQGWGYFDNAGYQGSWNPGLNSGEYDGYGGNAPEGQNVGFANPGGVGVPGGFAQVLTNPNATLTANTTYTLTVEVGNTLGYPWGGYSVQLLAGGTPHTPGTGAYTGPVTGGILLAEDNNSLTIVEDTFETSTVTHTTGGVSDPNVGLPLQIRLLSLGNVSADDDTEADFDDVTLFIYGELAGEYVYDPAPVTVELTLAVNDEGNPTPVEDSMTIDVYEDACKAAVGAGLATIEPSDFDENCITDLRDLAVMLAQWLVDYKATAPVIKP